MDDNIVVTPEPLNTNTTTDNEAKIKRQLKLATILGSVSLAGCLVLGGFFIAESNTNKQLMAQVNDNNAKVVEIEKSSQGTSDKIKLLAKNAAITQFEQFMTDGGEVTDNFAVNKLLLNTGSNGFSSLIDITTQPPTALQYKGLGKFDIGDRELRGMITDIVKKVGDDYEKYRKTVPSIDLPAWDTGEHTVTIKNYDIGAWKNGEFKLKGENK